MHKPESWHKYRHLLTIQSQFDSLGLLDSNISLQE